MSATSDLIQKIYIGYFGRAGDPSGLNYWVERSAGGMSAAQIAQSFSVQDEAKEMYTFLAAPSVGMGQKEFLNSVYQNLFGRNMDSEGETYWLGQLNNGRPVGGIILDIINGARNTSAGQDLTVITNKLAVANYYTEKVITSNANWTQADDQGDAIAVISGVTSSAATVTASKALADTLIAADVAPTTPTFTLTAGAASVNEGGTANFTLQTTNVAAGTQYSYTLSGVSAADVAGGGLSGIATIDANGRAVISVNLTADATTEGSETLTVTVAGQAASATVADTSTAPVPTYALAGSALIAILTNGIKVISRVYKKIG